MNKYPFNKALFGCYLTFAVFLITALQAQSETRPNRLLFLVDDRNWSDKTSEMQFLNAMAINVYSVTLQKTWMPITLRIVMKCQMVDTSKRTVLACARIIMKWQSNIIHPAVNNVLRVLDRMSYT